MSISHVKYDPETGLFEIRDQAGKITHFYDPDPGRFDRELAAMARRMEREERLQAIKRFLWKLLPAAMLMLALVMLWGIVEFLTWARGAF